MGFAGTVIHGSLMRRPVRTLFSIFGVALGIAIVIAIYTVDYNTVRSKRMSKESRQVDWSVDLEAQPLEGLGDPVAELAGMQACCRRPPFSSPPQRRIPDLGRASK